MTPTDAKRLDEMAAEDANRFGLIGLPQWQVRKAGFIAGYTAGTSDLERQVAAAQAECARYRAAIERVLADSESEPGGWGPDETMKAVLHAALASGPKTVFRVRIDSPESVAPGTNRSAPLPDSTHAPKADAYASAVELLALDASKVCELYPHSEKGLGDRALFMIAVTALRAALDAFERERKGEGE